MNWIAINKRIIPNENTWLLRKCDPKMLSANNVNCTCILWLVKHSRMKRQCSTNFPETSYQTQKVRKPHKACVRAAKNRILYEWVPWIVPFLRRSFHLFLLRELLNSHKDCFFKSGGETRPTPWLDLTLTTTGKPSTKISLKWAPQYFTRIATEPQQRSGKATDRPLKRGS